MPPIHAREVSHSSRDTPAGTTPLLTMTAGWTVWQLSDVLELCEDLTECLPLPAMAQLD